MAVLEVEVAESAESAFANDITQHLFKAHSRRVYSYCYRRLGSREEAEDAVQATYLNAWQSLRRGVRPDAPLPWLYGIAHNVCLTRHRSLRRRSRVERADVNAPEPASPASRRDELDGIDDALQALPRDQRKAFLLREWRGFSYSEIAHAMGLSNSAVESLIFRARRGLAASLEGGVREARAGGLCILELGSLGSLFSGFKTTLLGVLGTTGAKVATTVAVVTTATTVAAAPSHPRLSNFLTAPFEAAKAGVEEILPSERKSKTAVAPTSTPSTVVESGGGVATVAIVSQGAVVGVRPVTTEAPHLGPGIDADPPVEGSTPPMPPLPPEIVDPTITPPVVETPPGEQPVVPEEPVGEQPTPTEESPLPTEGEAPPSSQPAPPIEPTDSPSENVVPSEGSTGTESDGSTADTSAPSEESGAARMDPGTDSPPESEPALAGEAATDTAL